MGIAALILLTVSELALAVWSCRQRPEKASRRRARLLVRSAETGCVLLCVLLAPQRWRFVPALGILAVLLVLSALLSLRKGQSGRTGAGRAVLSCLLSVLVLTLALVPALLFTSYQGLPVSGAHPVAETSAILIDRSRTDPFERDGSFREVPVHFYYPADGAGRCPLVLFSHGAFGYYQSNTSTYLELAGNGYVVVSMDHPHHAFFTTDSDGKTVLVDRGFLSTAMDISSSGEDAYDAAARLDIYREWMDLRCADMGFVLDTVQAAAEAGAADDRWVNADPDALPAVLAMTDPAKVALMGHSMGGAASVALGRQRDDISAVIDIDGTMLGEYLGVEDGRLVINDTPYPVPVLEFNNWESSLDRAAYLAQGGAYPNDVLMRGAAEGFSTTVRDTKHMDFTDLPLFSPVLGNLLGSGTRSTEETMTIVNSLVLSFCNCYLKGEGSFSVQENY